ncbi:MAG TPA: hypothetical protein VJX73_04660 [Terracidiphilus sp.]|nr:hypothetical protein [Terracidiphilus sp.]
MNFRPKQLGACLVLLSAALFSLAPPLHAQTPADKAAAQALADKTEKLVRLMKEDDFNYVTTTSPTVFVIHLTGDHLKDIKVILAIGTDEDSDLVVFVTVTPKATMPTTADFRYILLKANHEYDQVKVGFDGDDDLSVRIDASMRVADATYLKNVINQVKNASDEIYGKIQPYLIH